MLLVYMEEEEIQVPDSPAPSNDSVRVRQDALEDDELLPGLTP